MRDDPSQERRCLLQWLAAGVAGIGLSRAASSQARLNGNASSPGVASGSPSFDSVALEQWLG